MIDQIRKISYLFAVTALVFMVPVIAQAGETVDLPDGSKLDLAASICPVCNMKAGGSPTGAGAVVLKDGTVVGFDGTSHALRYVLEPKAFKADTANIKGVYVTDYDTKKYIDAKGAFFVIGSDVMGSMGPEFIAFATKGAADKFSTAHKGKKVVAFGEVTLADVKPKKKMMKMKKGTGSGSKHK
jgi:copper chaperone NosL